MGSPRVGSNPAGSVLFSLLTQFLFSSNKRREVNRTDIKNLFTLKVKWHQSFRMTDVIYQKYDKIRVGRTVRHPRVAIFGSLNYVILINYVMHNHLIFLMYENCVTHAHESLTVNFEIRNFPKNLNKLRGSA